MGVSISSKNYSTDVPYSGFNRFRQKVADLTAPDIGEHYRDLEKANNAQNRDLFYKEHDLKTESLSEKYNHRFDKILNFLYMSDSGGSITYGTCKDILKVIGDYDDDKIYGYAGWANPAKFKTFKVMLEDCADNKRKLKWY